MSIHGRHSRERHRWLPALGLAVLIALMSVATGVITWSMARESDQASRTTGPKPAGQTSGPKLAGQTSSVPAEPRSPAVSGKLEECRTKWARQVGDALAADASVDQWRLHIDAMNQLTSGEITLAQATDYWDRSRHDAYRRVDDFRRVDGMLRSSAVRCRAATGAGVPDEQRQRLMACRGATRALSSALAAARVSVATWEHHIMDMDALRAGDITPQQATAHWLQSWRTGSRELQTYDRRAAEALRHHCG